MATGLSPDAEQISRDEAIEAIDGYGCYTVSGSDLADALELASAELEAAGRDEVQLVTVAEGTITFENGVYWLDRSI